jgi:hypothetical protein
VLKAYNPETPGNAAMDTTKHSPGLSYPSKYPVAGFGGRQLLKRLAFHYFGLFFTPLLLLYFKSAFYALVPWLSIVGKQMVDFKPYYISI